nr:reverse transcriptase domain-containing protein [Tanacetum cinerariifolium]
MSTRSSARNLFSPLDNLELIIRRRSHADPTLLNDFEMAAEGNSDLPVPDFRTMEELCQPSLNGRGGPIAPIAIQATNFGLKNDMIQQIIKVNGVTDNALRLYLFPHSLTHHATAWFDHMPRNSINTFEQMAKMFLGKYFPPSMVTKLKNEITNFRQRPDESLFEAWERYKLSIDRCGTFMKRRLEDCYDLIENMTAHHNDWDTSAQRTTVGQTQNVYAARAYQGNSYQPQGNTITNPEEDLKGITTRSGTAYEGPMIPTTTSSLPPVVKRETEVPKDIVHPTNNGSTKDVQPPVVQVENPLQNSEPVVAPIIEPLVAPVSAPKPNQEPSIPYPSRLHDQKLYDKANDQKEIFFQIFQDLNFNISFADALILMPKFGPTIKTLLTIKDKLSELARTPLNEHCSAVLLKKLPEKLGDPRKFLILCDFSGMDEYLALADLGTSINLMPLSVWNKLSLPELSPTCMTLEVADRSISRPVGAAEDVFVKVGTFNFPTDFVVVDFDADPRVPLILGRSFLKTERVLIDVFEGELTLREYSQEVLGFFDVITSDNPTPYYDPIVSTSSPTLTLFGDSYFLLEEVDAFLALEDDPTSPKVDHSYFNTEGDILLLKAFLTDDPSLPPPTQGDYLPQVRKELKIYEAKTDKSSIDEPPEVELKDLPPHLEYAFLEGGDKLLVIIAKDLSNEEKTTLIKVLKLHKRAIAWKLSDIKGINLEFCTHKILMEDDFKPTVQHQSRVNPKIYDVIKNEVLKLLDAGLIYPISDSPWEKIHFMVKEGIVLGHKISKNGIEVDKAKVEVIAKLPHPNTVKGIRSFLGHAGFYRRFIKDFSKIARPMTHLLEKDTQFFFSKECVEAFQTLKRKLTEAPILIAPDWDLPFELMCDASDFAIGVGQGQRQEKHFRPIHYASKTMTEAELNYTTTEKEMLAVVYAFEKFRSYLIMNKSIVYTDHSALKYLFAKKDSKARLLRWVLLLQEFKFKVIDTKGAENLAADHLSRLENPHQNVLDPKEINETFPLETLNIFLFVSSRGVLTARKPLTFSRLATMDPSGDIMARTTLPKSVKERFRNEMKCLKIPSKFVKFLTFGASTSWGRSRLHEGTNIYSFGTPRAIISDRGMHFCNDQFAKVMLKYDVTHRLATAYHPQTSRHVEVSNCGLKRILERKVGENRASWSDKLDDALWAFRIACKTAIGCTSYKLVYGKACHLPIELEHKAYSALKHANFDLQTTGDHRKVQLNELNELRDQAYENSLIYKEKTKRLHDSKIKDRIFNVGDRVLLFNSRLKIFSSKLKTCWSGPFTIIYVFPYGTVELSQTDRPNFKVNGHRLKHYVGEDIPKIVVPDL